MKRLSVILLLCLLFSTAFVVGKGPAQQPTYPDSLRSVWFYTEGIKSNAITGDSAKARQLFEEAIRRDSSYAPAYYQLAVDRLETDPEKAVEWARRARQLDTTNKWYHRFFGQALLTARKYAEALDVYEQLCKVDPKEPNNYRILAALYEIHQNPYMALITLDSAEIRFGRIPVLSAMKRHLLVTTHQMDRAIKEAQAIVAETPYEQQHRVALADLYAIAGKDSLAKVEYAAAWKIDSTSLEMQMALEAFYANKKEYRSLLEITRKLFLSEKLPVEEKIRRFEHLTSSTNFYRQYYLQLNGLISILAIRYPQNKQVVKLYAKHLIASGELEQALALYKAQTTATPPEEEFFHEIINIESYLQRPDSVARYVDRALQLFPDKPDFHISKGNVLHYTKRYDEAVVTYKQSLQHADTDSLRSVIWNLIGDAYQYQKEKLQTDSLAKPAVRKKKAQKAAKACYDAYERSLHYNKENVSTLNNYAYFLALDSVELEKALVMSSRVVELTDNNPTYLDTHAWVMFKMGRTAEAKRIMQQAIALDGQKSTELLVHYGDILFALKEYFLAETYWRKALEKGYDSQAIVRRIEKSRKEQSKK